VDAVVTRFSLETSKANGLEGSVQNLEEITREVPLDDGDRQ